MSKRLIKAIVYESHGRPIETRTNDAFSCLSYLPVDLVKVKDISPSLYQNISKDVESDGSATRTMTEENDPRHVRIKWMVCPINPSDLNQIEGNYSLVPRRWPTVAGNEGVAKVVGTGPQVSRLKKGDWVVPALPGFGMDGCMVRRSDFLVAV